MTFRKLLKSKLFLILAALLLLLLLAGGTVTRLAVNKNVHLWLPSYIANANIRAQRQAAQTAVTHVMFALVDHFEPAPDDGDSMADWMKRYPQLASRHRDSDGRPPRHTWVYPIEAYRSEEIDGLVSLCQRGLGEIEVHLHHGNDTPDSFRTKMLEGLRHFASHGVSVVRGTKGYRFAFVHGNWALDNSSSANRCGVNGELRLLRELGCFVDMTMPSAPDTTQTTKINSIYYATDDVTRPKSHDTGVDVKVGGKPSGDLMLIQGPLLPDWSKRKFLLLPGIENSAIHNVNPGRAGRIDLWVNVGISVVGRPEWVFVKTHTHGAAPSRREAVLGKPADEMFSYLETRYGSGRYRLHYVTAREMYNIVKAAEAGKTGNPYDYRDFEIPPYEYLEPDYPRGRP